MKNFNWEPKYNVISIYAFLVVAASILFGALVYRSSMIWDFFNSIVKYLIPFVYGFALAFILSPLMNVFEKRIPKKGLSGRVRRSIALLFTYLSALCLLVVFFLVVIPTLAESVTALAKNISTYSAQADTLITQLLTMIPMETVPQEVVNAINQLVGSMTSFIVASLLQLVTITSRVPNAAIDGIMGIIISLYMLSNKEMLFAQCKKILHAIMPVRLVDRLIDVAHDSSAKFSGFLIGKLVDSLIIGILCAVGMWIFKMPFITLVSLIIGVTNIIPYFGPFIGAIPGIILVFIGGGVGPAVAFAVFVLVLQQFDGNILGPAILGQSTGLDAMWVIFAILLFGGLYGFVGMIIGVPLLSVLFGLAKEFFHYRLQKKGLSCELDDYASEKHKLLSVKREK